ncbi:DUF4331 family protein [Streptomyces polyrhachis]|uniref:DUF4331 family protein n=1 Tax=Streptomyces polyrhachis TaxID=1282885 RepID=A0ABW2GFT0_9ACTN
MSHHLNTPEAAKNGQLYIDDFFVFDGERGTTLVMTVNSNVTGVYQKPGFHPEARYEFKIHLDGAEQESLTYRIAFGEADADGGQSMRLSVLTGADARDDAAEGTLLLEGRTDGTATSPAGSRLWAGRVQDVFYADGTVLGPVAKALATGTAVDLSGWDPAKAKNGFQGTSVEAIVLELPREDALAEGTAIGTWCATKLATDEGGWRQVNRGGHPMMWPLLWPTDLDFTNPANTRRPAEDLPQDGGQLAARIAAVVKANGSQPDPEAYAQLVVHRLYPDILTYTVGTPASYGFAAFNGRALADNVPEAMACLLTGTAINTGLRPEATAAQRRADFPYFVPA